MRYRYGDYPATQFQGYLKKLHSMVHWLLIYKENNDEVLDNYFKSVQYKIAGISSLLMDPPEIIELMVLIECAKNEFTKKDCDDQLYRRTILDAHSLIDKMGEKGE